MYTIRRPISLGQSTSFSRDRRASRARLTSEARFSAARLAIVDSPVPNIRPDTPQHPTWRAIGLEAVLYFALTIVLTWPLGRNLASNVPGDYGDPLLVSWIMGWVMTQLTAMLTGDTAAVAGFWHAPIFFPERNTLALSEHFTAQSVQALPVWWATGNLILSYSVVTILTFVLTALGTSLLVHDITGSRLAGVVAGLMAAFNPYRLLFEVSHLHVLSMQWLPFALLGLHRFIRLGSTAWLAFGAVSIVALNLSSGYYMLYAGPFIVLFVLVDILLHRTLLDRRIWVGLAVATLCVGLITTPFVVPYLNMQQQHRFARPLQEVVAYSATLDQYRFGLPWLAVMIVWAAAVGFAWRTQDRIERGHAMLFAAFSLLAFWLSLGPVVQAGGQPLGVPSAYRVLYDWVPGFHGLRVASRYAAVMLVFLPLSAAIGLAALTRRAPRFGQGAGIVTALLFLWLVWPPRFPINDQIPPAGLQPPPAYLTPSPQSPPIYRAVAGLDPNAVLAEFPFGDPWYELRYMFFAASHGKRLMNGYSGVFPASYVARQRRLTDPLASPAAASEALGGATHVVVHERAWKDDTGLKIEAWLESLGAVVVAEDDGVKLLALESLRRDARRADTTR